MVTAKLVVRFYYSGPLKMTKTTTLILLYLCTFPATGYASETTTLSLSLDTVWVATAAALVFFMQAGFALLESGISRSKNSINVIMKNYIDVCVGSLVFWVIGYGLMFGNNPDGWMGTDHFMLSEGSAFDFTTLLFQLMFAATAVTIASGAMAERTHFFGYIIGAIVITALIYPVFGSWVWGGLYGGQGWLARMGFIDFAGSTVVHSIGGWIALAGVIVLGPRLGRFSEKGKSHTIAGHNLTLVALGGFILWFGWFGFNGGSTLGGNADIGLINLNTQLAAAAGAVGTLVTLLILGKPVYLTTIINGSLGGLVAITAGCATMTPGFAIVTGLLVGPVLITSSYLLESMKIDDVVGAIPVHAFCGAWGTLAAGLFKTGDLFNSTQVIVQLIGIGSAFLWAFITAYLMYLVIDKTVGLRTDSISEQRGLDFSEHNEVAYPEFQQEQLFNK
jgi:Amt family ammonium transporter